MLHASQNTKEQSDLHFCYDHSNHAPDEQQVMQLEGHQYGTEYLHPHKNSCFSMCCSSNAPIYTSWTDEVCTVKSGQFFTWK